MSRAYHHRSDRRVIIQRVPVGELPRETVGAMDRLGGEVGRAIQGDQQLLPQDPETVEQMVLSKACKDLKKDGVAMAWGNGIEEGADLVVTGNRLDSKQGLGVMASLAGLEPALVLQKRGRLGKENAKSASSGVLHGVPGIGARLALVRQIMKASVQEGLERIKTQGIRHRCLLGSREGSTLAKSVSIGNLEPLAKPK